MHNSLSLTFTKTQLSTCNLWQILSADLKISSRYQDVNFLDGSEITVKLELTTTSNNEHLSTTTTIQESRFPHLEKKGTSEQRPPVNNGHYFCVPRVVVEHRFDCTRNFHVGRQDQVWKIFEERSFCQTFFISTFKTYFVRTIWCNYIAILLRLFQKYLFQT